MQFAGFPVSNDQHVRLGRGDINASSSQTFRSISLHLGSFGQCNGTTTKYYLCSGDFSLGLRFWLVLCDLLLWTLDLVDTCVATVDVV